MCSEDHKAIVLQLFRLRWALHKVVRYRHLAQTERDVIAYRRA